jgi:hypothetical protein
LWVFVVHTLQISTSHSSQKKIKSSLWSVHSTFAFC